MNQLITIAHIKSDFHAKFGIPRQSGLVRELRVSIIFVPEYRNTDALRGLETFSHIWLLWGFSEAEQKDWSPTVRPPRLGGNTRVGVFATRSPYRPNSIGMSSVKIERIEPHTPLGPVIHVLGADLLNGTPIYDIKPYLPFTDSHPDASSGFSGDPAPLLHVRIGEELLCRVPEEARSAIRALLSHDPRPAYQNDPARIYGLEFQDWEIKFFVEGDVLRVVEVAERAAD